MLVAPDYFAQFNILVASGYVSELIISTTWHHFLNVGACAPDAPRRPIRFGALIGRHAVLGAVPGQGGELALDVADLRFEVCFNAYEFIPYVMLNSVELIEDVTRYL